MEGATTGLGHSFPPGSATQGRDQEQGSGSSGSRSEQEGSEPEEGAEGQVAGDQDSESSSVYPRRNGQSEKQLQKIVARAVRSALGKAEGRSSGTICEVREMMQLQDQ